MHEMLEKIQSGEINLEDDYYVVYSQDGGNSTGKDAMADGERRQLGEKGIIPHWTPQVSPVKQGLQMGPQNIFRGDLAEMFTTKPDFSRCKLFGGQEICLPASRYFIR